MGADGQRRAAALHLLVIAVLSLAAYCNSFGVPFQFDDLRVILENPFVRHLGAHLQGRGPGWNGAYLGLRPVGVVSLALNYLVHREEVAGYHAVNLAVHVANAALVYWLVLLLFRTAGLSGVQAHRRRVALAAALLFALHPVQTQAVTYIVQRFASLATTFCLGALVAYLLARLAAEEKQGRAAQAGWLALAVICMAAAMQTKEIAFTFPLVIVLAEWSFFEGRWPARVARLVPLLVTMLIIPLRLVDLRAPVAQLAGDASRVANAGAALTRWEYLVTELPVVVTYLRLLVFPAGQNLDYDLPTYHSVTQPQVLGSLLLLGSIAAVCGFLLVRRRRAPSPLLRLVAFGGFWFFIALAVESTLVPIPDVIFEHRVYLPSPGFFIAVAAASMFALERFARPWLATPGPAVALLCVAVVLGALTFLRNRVWRSEVSLWEDVVQKSPRKGRGYNGLGLAYANARQPERARAAYEQAIALDPRLATAHNNLGGLLHGLGQHAQAVEAYSRGIALQERNEELRDNRGLAFAALGLYPQAAADYRKAIELRPDFAPSHHNLGVALLSMGDPDGAVQAVSRAIELDPDNPTFFHNRGLAYTQAGDTASAIRDFSEAIRLKPPGAEALGARALAQAQAGQLDEAVRDLSAAISLAPGKPAYLVNRAVAHAKLGRRDAARSDFQAACSLGDERGCAGTKQLASEEQGLPRP